jgi:hypothetical protein
MKKNLYLFAQGAFTALVIACPFLLSGLGIVKG